MRIGLVSRYCTVPDRACNLYAIRWFEKVVYDVVLVAGDEHRNNQQNRKNDGQSFSHVIPSLQCHVQTELRFQFEVC